MFVVRRKKRRRLKLERERQLEQEAFDRDRERERLQVLRLITEADQKDRLRLENARHHRGRQLERRD
jgi:hypothetical protein